MNSYIMKSRLGQGAFSTVYKALRKEDNCEYAMKKMRIMSLSDKEVSNCLNEVRILASIDHQNIVSYKDSFFDELTNTFCVVTELVEGGDLSHIILRHKANRTQIKEEFVWQVARQVLEGLGELHKNNIMHRDIKSANIFLTKNNEVAKLGDMNVSIVSNNGMAKTQTGTPYYASPEVWKEMAYNSKCDVWSLGVVLYEMAALRPPFEAKDLKSLKKNVMTGLYKRIPKSYSDQLENFIRLCLKVKPQQRSSVKELLQSDLLNKCFSNKNMSQSLEKSTNSIKILSKIDMPRKREFKMIKNRLPQSKFSSSLDKVDTDTIKGNRSVTFDKTKENLSILNNSSSNSNRILRKEPNPSVQERTRSSNNGQRQCIRPASSNYTKKNLPPLKSDQNGIFSSKIGNVNASNAPNIPKPSYMRA